MTNAQRRYDLAVVFRRDAGVIRRGDGGSLRLGIKETDHTLTNIAESFVNEAAVERDQEGADWADRKLASHGRGVSLRHARSTAAEKGATGGRARRCSR